MQINNNNYRMNFPILGIMFLIFMTLKLCGVIAWSWWAVTAPLWVPFAVIFAILAFVFTLSLFSKP